MFKRTDHKDARWHVLAGEQKKFARLVVLETVSDELEKALERQGIPIPDGPS
jgi:polyphosphate kinase 2 (PPK2 family)